ncbi:SIS domain-containing protein [Actinoplanes oblitus]|uniref:Glutamine--fructose-6-phosphate aminotransferase [isomerizing] n=1 Tax=Actinoplanes oblitus TaxID=3040509 RepID=A0ABY8WBN8_9ACTN|nr:SIS domain-containing protein [Actinoplanes oblitus]WIM95215.1 SIS domain-containing protein [Actinoplanes oblitus]
MTNALDTMIAAQPAALEALADPEPTARPAALLDAATRIWLVGTGTSQHAAELGADALLDAGRDARWVPAAGFTDRLLRPGDAVVVISHTGQTAYALRARRIALGAGAPLLTIAGPDAGAGEKSEPAPMSGQRAETVRTPVAETSETYTVSYTAALAVLAQLAHHLGAPGCGPEAIRAAAGRVRAVLDSPEPAEVPIPGRAMAITGPGAWSVTAREGALKIREGARILCEGFDPERLLHGAAVPYTSADALLVLQPAADPDGLTAAVADAARQAGLHVSTLAEPPSALPGLLAQIPMTVRLQLLALRFARMRGQNADLAITGPWAEPSLWRLGAP